MNSLPTGRTIPVNGKAVRALRMQKGWSASEVARRADLSFARYCEIEKGGAKVFYDNFVSLKDALELGNKVRQIVAYPEKALLSANTLDGLPVKIVIDVPAQPATDAQIEALQKGIEKLIDAVRKLVITGKDDGSIILTARIAEGDLLSLVAAFCQSRLDALQVTRLKIPGNRRVWNALKRVYSRSRWTLTPWQVKNYNDIYTPDALSNITAKLEAMGLLSSDSEQSALEKVEFYSDIVYTIIKYRGKHFRFRIGEDGTLDLLRSKHQAPKAASITYM